MQNLTPEEEKKLRIAYKQTFGTEAGQLVLKDLQKRCYESNTVVVPGDPYGTHVNAGARQVLLTIKNMMSKEGIEKLM